MDINFQVRCEQRRCECNKKHQSTTKDLLNGAAVPPPRLRSIPTHRGWSAEIEYLFVLSGPPSGQAIEGFEEQGTYSRFLKT